MQYPTTLSDWFTWQAAQNPGPAVQLGLERVRAVWQRLGVGTPDATVITVAGTNGKGSTCHTLSAYYRQAGYRVGLYTSPHLFRYNERIVIEGEPVSDAALCDAFSRIAAAMHGTVLTYFEWATLAAGWIFSQYPLDVWVLEVGMGGRFDAVNLWDPDCAVITHIDWDHQAYLGNTREAIGFQKAGIFRADKPAVCADRQIPETILHEPCARLYRWGQDFDDKQLVHCALPAGLHPDNAVTAWKTAQVLQAQLPVPAGNWEATLQRSDVLPPGRHTVRYWQQKTILWDVAHNPDSATYLASRVAGLPRPCCAIWGMLSDKDARGSCAPLLPWIDTWYTVDTEGYRGQSGAVLQRILEQAQDGHAVQGHVSYIPNSLHALERALSDPVFASVVVWGGFAIVAATYLPDTEEPLV